MAPGRCPPALSLGHVLKDKLWVSLQEIQGLISCVCVWGGCWPWVVCLQSLGAPWWPTCCRLARPSLVCKEGRGLQGLRCVWLSEWGQMTALGCQTVTDATDHAEVGECATLITTSCLAFFPESLGACNPTHVLRLGS